MSGLRTSRVRRSRLAEAINMTPLIDMMFILLLFFLVNTSFVREAGVEVKRPTAATAAVQEKAALVVAVLANGEIWVDRRAVDIRLLRSQVERIHQDNPEGSAVVLADRDARAGLLVQVMDQIRAAGIGDISIAASGMQERP